MTLATNDLMSGVLMVTASGMNPGLIGAYGSNIGVTPNLDELATYGILLDQCFVDSFDLREQLTSLATGLHALQSPRSVNLWQALEQAGDSPTFITDDPIAAAWAEETGCRQVGLIDSQWPTAAAERPIDCASVGLFEAAAHELANNDLHGLVWVHSRGLRGPWDAPLDLRQQFVDPEDPLPPSEVGPPDFVITSETDPDAVVGWGQVAAAQLSVLDESLGMLRAVLQSRDDAEAWQLVVVGLGGVPLGEHGRVGGDQPQCHAEELQCVAIFSPSPTVPIGWRRSELFQLADIGATLRSLCGLPVEGATWGCNVTVWSISESPQRWAPWLQTAIMRAGDQWWLRVPAWSAFWQADAEQSDAVAVETGSPVEEGLSDHFKRLSDVTRPKLYVKPDDRWEVSEVADRCASIVELLQARAIHVLAAIEQNQRRQLPSIEPELSELLR